MTDRSYHSLNAALTPVTEMVISVREQMSRDGLSLPLVSTTLRAWARHRGDVTRIVLNHTGKRYSLAILMEGLTLDRSFAAQHEVGSFGTWTDRFEPDIVIVGPAHADAPMFNRSGAYEIFAIAGKSPREAAA